MVETEQADIHMPQIAWFNNQLRDAFFRQGRYGGPNPMARRQAWWAAIATSGTCTPRMSSPNPAVQGVREHEDHVALYYALRRHADGMFNAKTGRTTASPAPIA